MESDKLALVRKIQQGDNVAYIELLLNNDKEQFLNQFKLANPAFYMRNEAMIDFDTNRQAAKFIVKAWKSRQALIPKFSFVPMQNEWFEVIQRIKLINS